MEHMLKDNLLSQAVGLLEQLVQTPSFSKEENNTAVLIEAALQQHGITVSRKGNNVWARNKHYTTGKPGLLLNSHHDTVKPNAGYTRNPFDAAVEDGKLYGLGSNDAGGPLVALLATFVLFYEYDELPFNIIYAATAEEEISGRGGVESIIDELGQIDVAIVGEPTNMQMAVAERGLMVLDCTVHGRAGHAANKEGVNAIYLAMQDIDWFRTYQFGKKSEWLGAVGMNVTFINAGQAHNQIPGICNFTVDIRLNECYTHEQLLAEIGEHVTCNFVPRSTRIKPSGIALNNPLVMAAAANGIQLFGSSATSDMALMPWPAVKIGPGDTRRSHSADEFIYLQEIESAIEKYTVLINAFAELLKKKEHEALA